MEKHCLKNDSNAMRHKSCKKTRFHVNSEMKLLALNDFCKQYYSILKYLNEMEWLDQNILQTILLKPRFDQDQTHENHHRTCI